MASRGKRLNEAAERGRSALEGLRLRAEAALEARPGARDRAPDPRAVEHELRVQEVELEMQNDELSRLNADLETAHDWYRELYDSAPVGYVTTSRTGTIVAANRLSGVLLGVPPQRLVTQRFDAFVEPASLPIFLEHRRQVLGGRSGHDCEVTLERADGKYVEVHLESAKQNRTLASNGWQMKTVLIDVTGTRRLERMIRDGQRELAHVLRVQTLGEVAPALAHEIAQPLQAVQANAAAVLNLLARRRASTAVIAPIARAIAQQSSRAIQILARARALARKAELELAPADANGVVRDVVSFVAWMAKERRVRIKLHLRARLPELRLDVVGTHQILLNLILNSFEAMADLPHAQRVIRISSSLQNDATVQITVADSGAGLRGGGTQHAEQIFGSFYSTKPGGLGLGLSISRRIAEVQGGTLRADLDAKPGATFVLTLPVATRGTDEPPGASAREGPGTGHG